MSLALLLQGPGLCSPIAQGIGGTHIKCSLETGLLYRASEGFFLNRGKHKMWSLGCVALEMHLVDPRLLAQGASGIALLGVERIVQVSVLQGSWSLQKKLSRCVTRGLPRQKS